MTKAKRTFINTVWKLRTYDVWGNPRDGYEVNDVFGAGTAEIRLAVTVYNPGTPQQFSGASPSDSQIRAAFGFKRFILETDGDDVRIIVNRARDGYPLGEMECISHDSLSPIRLARDAGEVSVA